MPPEMKQPEHRSDVKAESPIPGLVSIVFTILVFLAIFAMLGVRTIVFLGFAAGVLVTTSLMGRKNVVSLTFGSILGGGLGLGLGTVLFLALNPSYDAMMNSFEAILVFGFIGLLPGAIIGAIFVVYNFLNCWHFFDWFVNRGDQIIIIVNMITLFLAMLEKSASLGH